MGFAKSILHGLAECVKLWFMVLTRPQAMAFGPMVIVASNTPGSKIEEAHEDVDAEELQASAGA